MINPGEIKETLEKIAGSDKKNTKVLKKTNNTLSKLLKIEEKQTVADRKEQSEGVKHRNRLTQMNKRSEQDKGKGPFDALFGKQAEAKKEGKDLGKMVLLALGLATAGAAWLFSDDPNAQKLREDIQKEITKAIDFMKEELQKALNQLAKDLSNQLTKFADSLGKETGLTSAQETKTDEAPGTILEKQQQLREEIQSGNVLDNISGVQQERKEQLYYLESGEEMGYGSDFRKGGGAGKRGQGIVSGDVTDVMAYETGLSEYDTETLQKLDRLIRERRSLNDQVAGMDSDDPDREKIKKKLEEKDDIIGDLLENNKNLLEKLKKERDERYERINQPQKKQKGGPIDVPGTGSGDKVPMMLSPGSFVLNREASKLFPGFQEGGAIPATPKPTNVVMRQQGGSIPLTTDVKPSSEKNKATNAGTSGNKTTQKTPTYQPNNLSITNVFGAPGMNVTNLNLSPQVDVNMSMKMGGMKMPKVNMPKFKMPKMKGFGKSRKARSGKTGGMSGAKVGSAMKGGTSGIIPSQMNTGGMSGTVSSSSMISRSTNVAKRQQGGRISSGSVGNQRFNDAQEQFKQSVKRNVRRKVVKVIRSPQRPAPVQPAPSGNEQFGSGGGVNIVQMSSQLHRIKAGANY